MQKHNELDENWWPEPLKHLRNERPLENEQVTVAEIRKPVEEYSLRETFTALVSPDLTAELLKFDGGIGHEVRSRVPSADSTEIPPSFYIWAADIVSEGLESIVAAWNAGSNESVMIPDPRFLSAFGLVPRTIRRDGKADEIHWYDASRSMFKVITCKSVSVYKYGLQSPAWIEIHRDYLQEYATIRHRSLVQVYLDSREYEMTEDIKRALDINPSGKLVFPGRTIYLHRIDNNPRLVHIEINGVRLLVEPGSKPVSFATDDYGSLHWPGISGPVSKDRAGQMLMPQVYVSDEVLEDYEAEPDLYKILPDIGAVYYKGQWGFDRCHRIGRNLIQAELRKLYECLPSDVVRHWNEFAVDPPKGDISVLSKEPNIAIRAERLYIGLVKLGQYLTEISKGVMEETSSTEDFVSIDHKRLDYEGWWTQKYAGKVASHIPLELSESGFLARCNILNKVLVEGLKEKTLRKLLLALNVDGNRIKGKKSLKLLNYLVQICLVADERGLSAFTDTKDIEESVSERISQLKNDEQLPNPLNALYILHDLRKANDHRDISIDKLLERLGTDKDSQIGGWGLLLDKLYDKSGDALDECQNILRRSVYPDSV